MTTVRTLTVNGHHHRVAVEPFETLLDVLREKVNLSGTKKACNVGDCGACTVLVDGRPMNSCLLLADEMEGNSLTTIEGLARNGQLTAIQEAFVHEGAIQCGYCTPGQIMCGVSLLNENPTPTDEELRMWMSGNLCRCTGYQKIREAIHEAGKLMTGRS